MEPRGCPPVATGCREQSAHGKGRVDATFLLLKRGLPSWLHKEVEPREPEGSKDSRVTLTPTLRVRRLDVRRVGDLR